MDLEETVPAAVLPGVEVVHGLFRGAGHTAHGDHHVRGLRIAVVVEEMVAAAGDLGRFLQILLHDLGQSVVEGVVGLADLEVDIAVLDRVAQDGMLRIEGVGAEAVQRLPVHQGGKCLDVGHFDAGQLVGGPEAVKEVHEGNAALHGGQMGHGGQIGRFLDAAAAELGESGVPAGHDIRLVAEDAHAVCADGAGRHMQDAGELLARDPVEDRDHEHQALAGGVAHRQRARLQRAVDGADGARLGLHLHQPDRLAEHIFSPICAPLVRDPGHRR